MNVDKAEREKHKSKEFEKDKSASPRRTNGAKISEESVTVPPRVFPIIPGKCRTSNKGYYGPIKEKNHLGTNKETHKALATYITTTKNDTTDIPTNSNSHK